MKGLGGHVDGAVHGRAGEHADGRGSQQAGQHLCRASLLRRGENERALAAKAGEFRGQPRDRAVAENDPRRQGLVGKRGHVRG